MINSLNRKLCLWQKYYKPNKISEWLAIKSGSNFNIFGWLIPYES